MNYETIAIVVFLWLWAGLSLCMVIRMMIDIGKVMNPEKYGKVRVPMIAFLAIWPAVLPLLAYFALTSE